MYRVLFFWLIMTTTAAGSIVDSQVFINEFHYDNVGSDKGEFVEIAVPASWSNLSGLSLTLYNGGSGRRYGGPYSLDSFTIGDTVGGKTLYFLDLSLQNGAPDGMALADGTNVLQFLSYEGVFTASNGVAAGLASTDINVLEPSNTPRGFSLQLAGDGDSLFDFTWQTPAEQTRGSINHKQTFRSGGSSGGTVPEPSAAVLWLGLFAAGGLLWLRARHRKAVA